MDVFGVAETGCAAEAVRQIVLTWVVFSCYHALHSLPAYSKYLQCRGHQFTLNPPEYCFALMARGVPAYAGELPKPWKWKEQ
jgi:hypothetical protein